MKMSHNALPEGVGDILVQAGVRSMRLVGPIEEASMARTIDKTCPRWEEIYKKLETAGNNSDHAKSWTTTTKGLETANSRTTRHL